MKRKIIKNKIIDKLIILYLLQQQQKIVLLFCTSNGFNQFFSIEYYYQNRENASSRGSGRPEKTTGLFPKIAQGEKDESKLSTKEGELIENPFYVPDDYEIFKMKEKEKEVKKQERAKNQNLKIWEKGIKNKGMYTVGKLKEMCRLDENQDEETLAKLNIVDAANSAIKNRVRQKEPMHQFIDKKRDMLLFQMMIDHKRDMINKFEETTRLHRQGLEKSEQMLEEDLELFNRFLEENKNNSRDAIKKAEDETKKKQEKVNEIKTLVEHKADLMTKNAQKIEYLDDLWKYKKFLDRVTPKDYLDMIDKRKQDKAYVRGQQKLEQTQHLKIMIEKYNLSISQDIAELLEDSDEEFEMYFKTPNQLEEIFQGLEERNLFLIANTKEREQMVEELRHKYEARKKHLEERQRNSQNAKNDLHKNIDTVSDQIKTLRLTRSDDEAQEQLRSLEQQIERVYRSTILPEKAEIRKDMIGIEMLKEMEKRLENYIKELKSYRTQAPELVQQKEKDCIADKREQQKLSRQEQENKEQQEKQKQQQQQILKEKRTGRPIMVRSWPPQEEKEEEVIQEIPEEEIERQKYFM